MHKLGLGTVQFGQAYGISNAIGQTPLSEVNHILAVAWQAGIRLIDTAYLYGESETILGKSMAAQSAFKIVSKTLKFAHDKIHAADGKKLQETFKQSLTHLQKKNIYALLMHEANDLLKPGAQYLLAALQQLKIQGIVEKIGVSIYTPCQIDKVLNVFIPDMMQVPINVFDQRLLQNGYLKKLKALQIEVHARSVFLQGLLLMQPAQLPHTLQKISTHLQRYQRFAQRKCLAPFAAALNFVYHLPEVDYVICGVNTASQLQQLLAVELTAANQEWQREFAVEDETILNPSRWF